MPQRKGLKAAGDFLQAFGASFRPFLNLELQRKLYEGQQSASEEYNLDARLVENALDPAMFETREEKNTALALLRGKDRENKAADRDLTRQNILDAQASFHPSVGRLLGHDPDTIRAQEAGLLYGKDGRGGLVGEISGRIDMASESPDVLQPPEIMSKLRANDVQIARYDSPDIRRPVLPGAGINFPNVARPPRTRPGIGTVGNFQELSRQAAIREQQLRPGPPTMDNTQFFNMMDDIQTKEDLEFFLNKASQRGLAFEPFQMTFIEARYGGHLGALPQARESTERIRGVVNDIGKRAADFIMAAVSRDITLVSDDPKLMALFEETRRRVEEGEESPDALPPAVVNVLTAPRFGILLQAIGPGLSTLIHTSGLTPEERAVVYTMLPLIVRDAVKEGDTLAEAYMTGPYALRDHYNEPLTEASESGLESLIEKLHERQRERDQRERGSGGAGR